MFPDILSKDSSIGGVFTDMKQKLSLHASRLSILGKTLVKIKQDQSSCCVTKLA